jgi:hypothetical protein
MFYSSLLLWTIRPVCLYFVRLFTLVQYPMYDLTHRWLTNLKSHQNKNTLAYLSRSAVMKKKSFKTSTLGVNNFSTSSLRLQTIRSVCLYFVRLFSLVQYPMYNLTHRWLTNLKSHQNKNTLAYLFGAAVMKESFKIST